MLFYCRFLIHFNRFCLEKKFLLFALLFLLFQICKEYGKSVKTLIQKPLI